MHIVEEINIALDALDIQDVFKSRETPFRYWHVPDLDIDKNGFAYIDLYIMWQSRYKQTDPMELLRKTQEMRDAVRVITPITSSSVVSNETIFDEIGKTVSRKRETVRRTTGSTKNTKVSYLGIKITLRVPTS